MFDFIKRTFFVFAKTTTIGSEICSPFLALKKLLLPLSHRVAWDKGCPGTAQANVWSWSSKKSRPQPEITDKDLKKGFREVQRTDCSLGKKSSWDEVDPRRENCFSTLFLKTGISCLFLWCVYVSELVGDFHSCPLALRSGHNRKKNLAISSCGSTYYLEGAVAYSYSWISWRYRLCFYEVIAMVTLWPLTFRTAPKWKKLTQFFYHEWLLDVVVEDWDITPILLMHFLKWICKCISFQSYWVLSDTLQQSMFDFIRRIFCCGRKNQPPTCSPFLALKKLLFPLSYRVAWDDGCPVTTQANVRSWSRKKTGLTCPEITDERLKEGSTKNKNVVNSQLHAKKIKERRSWR